MPRKTVSRAMLILLTASMLAWAFNIQSVKASATIYIRADGSVDPPTVPIQRDGNVYTFASDIYGSVIVEKNNVMIDGAGYSVIGTKSEKGIHLSDIKT